MKTLRSFFLITLVLLILDLSGSAQQARSGPESNTEQAIRKLDLKAAKAVLDHDEKGIARYFAANSVTNNPRNGLTLGNAGVIEAAKGGLIDYYKFERSVESVQVLGATVITMGRETIIIKNERSGPGATYNRRYTNVWMRKGATWQIVARHASIICDR